MFKSSRQNWQFKKFRSKNTFFASGAPAKMGACTFFTNPEVNILIASKLKDDDEKIRCFTAFFALIGEKRPSTFEGFKDCHVCLDNNSFRTMSADAALFIKDLNNFSTFMTKNNIPLCISCLKETGTDNPLFVHQLSIPFLNKFPRDCQVAANKVRSKTRFEINSRTNLGEGFTSSLLELPMVAEFEGCNLQSTDYQVCKNCVEAVKGKELNDKDNCAAAFQNSAFGLALNDAQVCALSLLAINFCTCMQIYIYIYIYMHIYICI